MEATFGSLQVNDARRLRLLEDENRKLKKLVRGRRQIASQSSATLRFHNENNHGELRHIRANRKLQGESLFKIINQALLPIELMNYRDAFTVLA